MTEPDYPEILLQLIASLTLCDHMGDVSNDMQRALELAGVAVDWDDEDELRAALHAMGVTTLYGTSLEG